MRTVNHGIDRVRAAFDEESLVAGAGLVLVATVVSRLGLEALVNSTVRLVGRVGGSRPGRKVLTLVHAMAAGANCIDDADRLRAGATGGVLGHRVMAPSTLGTFLRSFSFGHVRQLDATIAETIRRAWSVGAGPGDRAMTIDLDSTVCEVHGKHKHGAAYGYTKVLGYHPLLATRADTGEVLHARMRKGSANTQRGAHRFVEELIARVRRCGAAGPLTLRADSGFWSHKVMDACIDHDVDFSIAVRAQKHVVAAIEAIDEDAWVDIDYTDRGRAQVALPALDVTGEATLDASEAAGRFELAQTPLEPLRPLLPNGRPLEGAVTASVDVRVPWSDPLRATADARVTYAEALSGELGASATQPFTVGWHAASANAAIAPATARADRSWITKSLLLFRAGIADM